MVATDEESCVNVPQTATNGEALLKKGYQEKFV